MPFASVVSLTVKALTSLLNAFPILILGCFALNSAAAFSAAALAAIASCSAFLAASIAACSLASTAFA